MESIQGDLTEHQQDTPPTNIAQSFELQGYNGLPLPPAVRRWMTSCGHTQPTPLQLQVLPRVAAGNSCLVHSVSARHDPLLRLLPSVLGLSSNGGALQAIALYPTKELAIQDLKVAKPLCNSAGLRVAACVGGIPKQVMMKNFSQPIDVCFATPKCFVDVCESGYMDVSTVKLIVLHDMEELMALAISEQVDRILRRTAPTRHGVIFSKETGDSVVQHAFQLFTSFSRHFPCTDH
eukprot:EG_transcript_18659